MSEKKSKHYYDKDRNIDNAKQNSTWVDEIIEDVDRKWGGDKNDQYNGKTRTGGLENDSRVPDYYKGKNGYEARKVCDNFDLSYHLGTATTYILRAYHKHDSPKECITKAIAHLQFELEKINDEKV